MPLIQIHNAETGEEIIREMTAEEVAALSVSQQVQPAPTKEQLLAQLQALQAQINALGA